MFSNSDNTDTNSAHCCYKLSVKSSSQENFSLQRSCKNILPKIRTGDSYPIGSNKETTSDRTERFVEFTLVHLGVARRCNVSF